MTSNELHEINTLDVLTIERQARAMQARAVADMARALRRSVASLFTRGSQTRAA